MKLDQFPETIRPYIIPRPGGELIYRCLGCKKIHAIENLLYTCPNCGQVLMLQDRKFERLKKISGSMWRQIFDYRKMTNLPALKGIYRYYEFLGPIIPTEAVVYLGEGHTPIVEANAYLQSKVGARFFFKNDGQNPSASFKDRGMASALSYLHYLLLNKKVDELLVICASTGDTSAAAALYASYLQPKIKSAVLLPHKKVTPQQLAQPLGSGARVIEIPGVFDDCMKVVEVLSEDYNVALLNSKNAWRILGQESYAYEIAQDLDYDLNHVVVVVPIGNAGNITAIMNGFLKFYEIGIINKLPKIIGVQSHHANPVYRYYSESDPRKRHFKPISVKPSVAQAAMIGNPVSMPRVIHLAEKYDEVAGRQQIFFVEVSEQEIIDWMLVANRNGNIVCTHGGESLAGLVKAQKVGITSCDETAIIDSTSHILKFSGFQQDYFENRIPESYGINPRRELVNSPLLVNLPDHSDMPPSETLDDAYLEQHVRIMAEKVANILELNKA